MRAAAGGAAGISAWVLACAAACIALLVIPGQTVVSVYVNDLFIFLDGAHRIASGQVPNRDFHTALGPLVYYLPAAGYALTGSLGSAMPAAMALSIALLAPPMVWILASRVRPLLALPFAAFLVLITAVPLNLGEAVSALSFAMFYNRIAWVALALLVIMYLAPERPLRWRILWDACSAAFLVLLMLYSKISYGAVAVALLGLVLLHPAHRSWAALALALVAAAALTAEAFWGGTAAYVADLRIAGNVSGGMRGGFGEIANTVLHNFADYVLYSLLVGLVLWRSPRILDFLFYGFCAASGLLIVIQNSQAWGIITLHAGAIVAAESLVRGARAQYDERPWSLSAGAPIVMLALVLPTIAHCAIALGLHAVLASERPVSRFGLPRFDRIRVANLWPVTDYEFSVQFLSSLEDGANAIAGLDASRIVVLDFIGPFSAGLGLQPPRGDSSWLHWGRNIDDRHYVPPLHLLADASIVLEAKRGINGAPLWRLYGSYVEANFEMFRETDFWRVHLRRERPTAASETL